MPFLFFQEDRELAGRALEIVRNTMRAGLGAEALKEEEIAEYMATIVHHITSPFPTRRHSFTRKGKIKHGNELQYAHE